MARKASKAIPKTTKGKDKNYLPTSQGAGMTAKGRAAYNKKNGSNLQAPQPQGGPRKKSFCARMSGVPGPTSKDGKLTRKGAALKRWAC
jgi:hypothetical protein